MFAATQHRRLSHSCGRMAASCLPEQPDVSTGAASLLLDMTDKRLSRILPTEISRRLNLATEAAGQASNSGHGPVNKFRSRRFYVAEIGRRQSALNESRLYRKGPLIFIVNT